MALRGKHFGTAGILIRAGTNFGTAGGVEGIHIYAVVGFPKVDAIERQKA